MNPELYTIAQEFPRPRCPDIAAEVHRTLSACTFQPGAKIALAVGSRGIAGLAVIVKAAAEVIRSAGASPLIVPAMGSHGGATAEGQVRVLAEAGISTGTMGVPVVSSMEVIELPAGTLGNRVFMDRHAADADGIVLVNRIKPHTDFQGSYESGLVKMAVIGLGKHAGAVEIHSFGVAALRERLAPTFEQILHTGKLLGGLAIVENAYDETALIEAIPANRILDREPELLEIARQNMPRLPVGEIDVLIIDRMGKEISGVGLDPNIIGRIRILGQPEPASPRIKSIMVSELSAHSYGNAIGIGLADIISKKLYEAIDFDAMYVNAETSLFLERIKVPFIAETDAAGFTLALKTCGRIPAGTERIVRIRDTLTLGELQVSRAILNEIRDSVTIVRDASPIFDQQGSLIKK